MCVCTYVCVFLCVSVCVRVCMCVCSQLSVPETILAIIIISLLLTCCCVSDTGTRPTQLEDSVVCPQKTQAKLFQEKRGRSHLIYSYVLYSKKGVHNNIGQI